jgi:glycosyltransferase involved in cell wall biosynthesis
MKATASPAVSVIIPAHNAAGRLPTLLAALGAQGAERETFEVIVVDDASSDETALVVEDSDVARLVSATVSRGSYAARNLAIAQARGSVLAFTDTDCTPATDWIANGLAALERADIIAGHVDVQIGERPTAATLLGIARRHIDQEHRVTHHGFGATANLWMRRRVMDEIGPFRDDLISGGDAEFGHRAQVAGLSLRYAEEVLVTHPPRSQAKALLKKQLRLGYGAAQRRGKLDGALHAPRIWTRPRHYLPRRTIYGREELARRGYRLTARDHVRVRVLQYFCCQLPLALGNLAGTIATHRERRGSNVRPS